MMIVLMDCDVNESTFGIGSKGVKGENQPGIRRLFMLQGYIFHCDDLYKNIIIARATQ
jgi:hypothetical protein